jgi:hypothetical protein
LSFWRFGGTVDFGGLIGVRTGKVNRNAGI